jgi:hypothetical protein
MQITDIYKQHSPAIIQWIQTILNDHSQDKTAISALAHPGLQAYFPASVLENSFAIYTGDIPVIPFHAIPELSFMNQFQPAGITYLDTFFIINEERENTSIHFHELIHVLQWKLLGMEKFLLCYGHGLFTKGYRDSPLERMAFDLESRFSDGEIFNAPEAVFELIRPIQKLAEELSGIK